MPFFLPYLYVQEEMGFARTLDDARQYSADLGAWVASSAWAHRWWLPALGDFNEVLFPGHPRDHAWLGRRVALGDRAVARLRSRGAARRDVAILYVLIARLRVLVVVRTGRRALSRVLRDDSDLLVPPRAGPDGHHGDVVAGRVRLGAPSRTASPRVAQATARWRPRLRARRPSRSS